MNIVFNWVILEKLIKITVPVFFSPLKFYSFWSAAIMPSPMCNIQKKLTRRKKGPQQGSFS